jgi:alpha-ketoglutarate-dependent taurine dioxygenase
MKVSKIPGLGRFGVFIDDLDFATITNEEWMEVGKLHMESLVTIIRNVKVEPKAYEQWIYKWGTQRVLEALRLNKKHSVVSVGHLYGEEEAGGVPVDPKDQEWVKNLVNVLAIDEVGPQTAMLRVSGKKDENGRPIGMFQEGELLWHSNESGNLEFSPGVALLGHSGVVGSATGFLTTPDWYESQSESFRSELDEMIICHEFTPGRINPGLREEQDDIMYRNMCPQPTEIPLVISSPIGIKGLHYSINTINTIKGMTKEESDKVFDYINKTLFVDEYIYDHWYQQDNDLCLFDNSITLHRRLGGIADRMCYRIQYDYDKVAPVGNRYYQEPYNSLYKQKLKDISNLVKQYKYFNYE